MIVSNESQIIYNDVSNVNNILLIRYLTRYPL